MGNTMTYNLPCCGKTSSSRSSTLMAIKLIFYGGETRMLTTVKDNDGNKRNNNIIIAGEIMFEFPDHMVCHADSFFIGHPIPALAIDDQLLAGETYFVLPLDRFGPSSVLSVSSLLASLGGSGSGSGGGGKPGVPVKNNKFRGEHFPCPCPLQYVKSSLDGRVLIKVVPEFMINLIMKNSDYYSTSSSSSADHRGGLICSTPELKKHYEQLVGCTKKVQGWSPKLETISEYNKIRYSPCRFLGFERKLGE